MNENDDGGFGLDFGIDDEGLDRAIAMLERNIFMVARRGFEAGFCPVLRLDRSGSKGKEKSSGEEFESARHRERHGEECRTQQRGGTSYRV